MKTHTLLFTLLLFISCNSEYSNSKETTNSTLKATETHPNWIPFTADIFEKAKANNKLVILNLHANWCHWCHVMDDSTYSNTEVVNYMSKHYLSASEDHDERTDLAERYRAYGWPATIVFDADGNEIVKRAGYMSPENFLNLLKAIVKDPTPEEESNSIPTNLEKQYNSEEIYALDLELRKFVDSTLGGFNTFQKSVHKNTYLYALQKASDPFWKNWLDKTTFNSKGLIDEVWGGIYQYSTRKSWNNAHFEKLLAIQARYMELYSLYGATHNSPKIIDRAIQIDQYLQRFMRDNIGLYYNAQDADVVKGEHADHYFKLNDKERLKIGIPAIDKNTYTKENAQLGLAYLTLFGATNKKEYYANALTIYKELSKRKTAQNLYKRSPENEIINIGDNIAMAKLTLQIYELTGEIKYKKEATLLTKAIVKEFKAEQGNCYKSYSGNTALKAKCLPKENYELARYLQHFTAYDNQFKLHTTALILWLQNPKIVDELYDEAASILLEKHKNETVTKIEVFGTYNATVLPELIAPVLSWASENYKVVFADQETTSQENPFGDKLSILICGPSFCSRPFENYTDIFNYWHERLSFVKN